MLTRLLLAAAFALPIARAGGAQSIPSPSDVLGHALGEHFTDAAGAVRYAEALAAASPEVDLVSYGETVEGRPLVLLVLASEANLARLPSILEANARLLDPELSADEAGRIARANPVIAWLTYGIHGDESASTEAALWTAWDVARASDETAGILDSLIVLIDPVANPDGRDRYVNAYRSAAAARPNAEPGSREHGQPWPGGRYNHYLFDLNRDWTWATQEETRARLREWTRWNPQLHIDFHEMGYNSTYFFFPAAEPLNPVFPDYTVRWGEYFGRANAAAFDARRWLYFTGETFDLLYPGFGDTWPSLVGAIGMTYEQAGGGAAGLAVRREDGSILTLAERATHHRVAGLTTLRAAAARKTALLSEFAGFHRTQGDGLPDILLVPGPEAGAVRSLAASLQSQGIRVERATRAFRGPARPHPGFEPREEFPVGTLRVRSRQARGRLAFALLRPEARPGAAVGETFDITAWSLPYAFGVEAHTVDAVPPQTFEPVPALGTPAASMPAATEAYGWLVAPSFAAAGRLFRYLETGGRALAIPSTFELHGTMWPPGTVFVPGDPGASESLRASGLATLAEPVAGGWTPVGPDLGTGSALTLKAPRIALLAGEGFRPGSVGAVWHLLESWADVSFDILDAPRLRDAGLSAYDVVILPSGRPSGVRGDVMEAVADWVRRGGTLVSLGGSSRWVASELAEVGLRRTDEGDLTEEDRVRSGLRTLRERRFDAWDEAVQGIILPLDVDTEHPLAWGLGRGNESGRMFALHLEDLAFEPAPDLETVASFGADLTAVSGAISPTKLTEIAASSWLVMKSVGDGKVIMFADDILFRLMWRSSFVAFTNALLFGPALR